MKVFFQIMLLVMFAGLLFWLLFPRWNFYESPAFKANRFSGKVYQYEDKQWKVMGQKQSLWGRFVEEITGDPD